MIKQSGEVKQKRFGIKRKRDGRQPVSVDGLGACQPVAVSAKRRRQKSQPITFSEKELKNELLRDARALKMPAGAAEAVATKVTEQVSKWAARRAVVTTDDIRRRVATEVEKYSADLAYVYQNRGKII